MESISSLVDLADIREAEELLLRADAPLEDLPWVSGRSPAACFWLPGMSMDEVLVFTEDGPAARSLREELPEGGLAAWRWLKAASLSWLGSRCRALACWRKLIVGKNMCVANAVGSNVVAVGGAFEWWWRSYRLGSIAEARAVLPGSGCCEFRLAVKNDANDIADFGPVSECLFNSSRAFSGGTNFGTAVVTADARAVARLFGKPGGSPCPTFECLPSGNPSFAYTSFGLV